MEIKYWTREQYEDFFQELTRAMLPNFNKKNIRPSYQTVGGYAAKNVVNQQYSDGISGFSEKDNFIYLKVKFKPVEQSYTDLEERVFIQRYIDITYSVYGENSAIISSMLVALIRAPEIIHRLNRNNLYLDSTTSPEEARESIAGAWWERHDFTVSVNENIEIVNPNILPFAESTNISIITD